MSLTFRDATDSDVPMLAELNERLIRDEGHRNRMSRVELAERMRGWLSSGEYAAVLFEQDGVPAGYTLFRREPDHVYLRQFYVVPDCRGSGVGRTAIDWLIANRWSGAGRIRLDVLVGNEPGHAFWKSVGFTEYCVTMERDV